MPWRSRELTRPWQVVFLAVASSLGPATPTGTLLPPKNFHGAARGYQEPSGAKQTGQDGPPGLTNKTRWPTGTGSPPGLISDVEAS